MFVSFGFLLLWGKAGKACKVIHVWSASAEHLLNRHSINPCFSAVCKKNKLKHTCVWFELSQMFQINTWIQHVWHILVFRYSPLLEVKVVVVCMLTKYLMNCWIGRRKETSVHPQQNSYRNDGISAVKITHLYQNAPKHVSLQSWITGQIWRIRTRQINTKKEATKQFKNVFVCGEIIKNKSNKLTTARNLDQVVKPQSTFSLWTALLSCYFLTVAQWGFSKLWQEWQTFTL